MKRESLVEISQGEKHRPMLRNANINYSRGTFFVTMQAAFNKTIFGAIVGEKCVLNGLGEAIAACLRALGERYAGVEIDEFVVMPNHVHFLIKIGVAYPPSAASAEGGAMRGGLCPRDKPPLISTFTSAQERSVFAKALASGRRFVKVCPGGIPPENELEPRVIAACNEGRGLLISPAPSGTGVNKQRAVWCNEYILKNAAEVWAGDITPGHTLASLVAALRPPMIGVVGDERHDLGVAGDERHDLGVAGDERHDLGVAGDERHDLGVAGLRPRQ